MANEKIRFPMFFFLLLLLAYSDLNNYGYKDTDNYVLLKIYV